MKTIRLAVTALLRNTVVAAALDPEDTFSVYWNNVKQGANERHTGRVAFQAYDQRGIGNLSCELCFSGTAPVTAFIDNSVAINLTNSYLLEVQQQLQTIGVPSIVKLITLEECQRLQNEMCSQDAPPARPSDRYIVGGLSFTLPTD